VSSAKHMSRTVQGAAIDRVAAGIHNRVGPWLHTREGVASASISVVAFWILWAAVGAPLLTALLVAASAVILVSLAARLWESCTAPDAGAFSRIKDRVDGSVELQQDPNAGFWRDSRGFLWGNRIWFAGTGCPPCQLRPDTYLRFRAWRDQGDLPVFVARARRRQWWWWQNAFYWESIDCGPEDVAALLVMLERDDVQGLGWELDVHLAEPIPEDVKRLVYERDRGRCLACGSDELIQYDHVVPWSMGGGNEPHNIRLLCAGCNRRQAIGGQDRSRTASASA
jgi:HNH endonuclease